VSLLLAVFMACSGDGGTDTAGPMTPSEAPTADTAVVEPPACPTFGDAEAVGIVVDPTLTELSGLVHVGDRLWAHNDSSGPVLVGLSDTGAVVQQVTVAGMVVFDWEDLAVRGDHLWLADTGDNLAVRGMVWLHEVPIPTEDDVEVEARTISARWPQGPVDCEAAFADPISGDLLLMSKVFDGIVTVARLPDPDGEAGEEPVELEVVGTVVFGADGIGGTTLVTGADMSPDGRFVVVRTYTSAWVFPRVPGEAWADTFGREPCEVPTGPERQGEAIAWGDGALWTVSEGEGVPLHRTAVGDGAAGR
jgi:hypothetical protein